MTLKQYEEEMLKKLDATDLGVLNNQHRDGPAYRVLMAACGDPNLTGEEWGQLSELYYDRLYGCRK